jgi:hypothetical protein
MSRVEADVFSPLRWRRTLLSHKREYEAFQRWCQNSGRTALPCSRETIVAYVSHLCRTPAPEPQDNPH